MEMENRWFGKVYTPEELSLLNYVEDNQKLFDDMLFKEDTFTHDLISITVSDDHGLTWHSDSLPMPDEFEYFDYSYFDFKIAKIDDNGTCGQYDQKNQTVTISPDYVNDESTILHELIHLHEDVLNEQPLFYHDAYLWYIYKKLQDQIPDIDSKIKDHCHFLNEESLYKQGGIHDLLFLLKSYDIDLIKNYPLGTVFGYGYTNDK